MFFSEDMSLVIYIKMGGTSWRVSVINYDKALFLLLCLSVFENVESSLCTMHLTFFASFSSSLRLHMGPFI